MMDIIKDKVKERYGKIALTGNSDCCCMPGGCTTGDAPIDAAKLIGYSQEDLKSIPGESVLGVGCGAPIKFADLKEGEMVVDLGSGAGIDVFLSANKVSHSGKAIGIDMTGEMIEKARQNAANGKYTNVEFRKGDVENGIPIDDNVVDVVTSNCVINLVTDKTNAFKEVYRILRDGGRMVISDLITDTELSGDQVNHEQWCSCIDGALTREHYIECIKKAGFHNISVLDERVYMEGERVNGRKITSLVIKAIK
jgi:SAM-dependent methyltransferase